MPGWQIPHIFHTGTLDFKEELYAPVSYNCKRNKKKSIRSSVTAVAEVFRVIQGVPREDVLEVSKRWGYFSEKDNRLDEFDLCEQC